MFFPSKTQDFMAWLDGQSSVTEELVPIEDWLHDPYYVGDLNLWPVIEDAVIEFMTGNYCEGLITGGTRSGKSFFTSACLLRVLYELSVLRSPQKEAGLSPSSKLILINLSVAGYQAEGGIYSELRNLVADSPYFQTKFPFDSRVVASMRFPKRIYYVHGSGLSDKDLGLNVVAGCYDEVNRATTIERSARSRDASGEFNQVEVRYEELSQRIRQTTMMNHDERSPFRVIALGSRERVDDFISKRMEKLEEDPHTFIRHFIAPETRPQHVFMDEKFTVDIGGPFDTPEIIETDLENYTPKGELLKVPMNYYRDAKTDLPGMLKLVYGIIKQGIEDKYFKNPQKIRTSFSRPLSEHPYSVEIEDFNFSGDFILERFMQDGVIRHKDKPRFIHIDMTLSGCNLGFVMGHCAFDKTVYRLDDSTMKEYTERLPVTYYDLILAIDPKGQFIDPSYIRNMVYKLQMYGFNIQLVTGDQYAFSSLIEMRKKGIQVEQLSIDRNINVQTSMRTAIGDGRLLGYSYPTAMQELYGVLEGKDGKIVKPDGGSKDVLDALIGVNWNVQRFGSIRQAMWGTSASAGSL